MLKIRTLICTLTAMSCIPLDAAAQPVGFPFANRMSKFSTNDHPKARGLRMTIAYPADWAASEGDGQYVLKKFISEGGAGVEMVLITVTPIPGYVGTPFSRQELTQFFTPAGMKGMLPKEATYLDAKPVEIAGQPGGLIQYSSQSVKGGLVTLMRTAVFMFVQRDVMVQIQCSVRLPPVPAEGLARRMGEFMPLFQQMVGSIELERVSNR